jgi:hypothetical protein
MIIFERVNNLIKKFEAFFVGGYIQSNKELVFILCLVTFPILTRIIPLFIITAIFVVSFLLYVLNHFYFYINRKVREENKQVNVTEYSWGFVQEPVKNLDTHFFLNYLKTKNFTFYREYLSESKDFLILLVFLFGDLVVAFARVIKITSSDTSLKLGE